LREDPEEQQLSLTLCETFPSFSRSFSTPTTNSVDYNVQPLTTAYTIWLFNIAERWLRDGKKKKTWQAIKMSTMEIACIKNVAVKYAFPLC
jgi:hypothetical protein